MSPPHRRGGRSSRSRRARPEASPSRRGAAQLDLAPAPAEPVVASSSIDTRSSQRAIGHAAVLVDDLSRARRSVAGSSHLGDARRADDARRTRDAQRRARAREPALAPRQPRRSRVDARRVPRRPVPSGARRSSNVERSSPVAGMPRSSASSSARRLHVSSVSCASTGASIAVPRRPRRRPGPRGRRRRRRARRRPGSGDRASSRRRAPCSRCSRPTAAAGSSSAIARLRRRHPEHAEERTPDDSERPPARPTPSRELPVDRGGPRPPHVTPQDRGTTSSISNRRASGRPVPPRTSTRRARDPVDAVRPVSKRRGTPRSSNFSSAAAARPRAFGIQSRRWSGSGRPHP